MSLILPCVSVGDVFRDAVMLFIILVAEVLLLLLSGAGNTDERDFLSGGWPVLLIGPLKQSPHIPVNI